MSGILVAVRDKLINDGLFPASACYISLTPDVNLYPPTDQFAVVSPGTQTPDPGVVMGGGNITMLFVGEVIVTLWSRLATDEIQRDETYLTDASLGAVAAITCMLTSLQLYMPENQDGSWMLSEPMRLTAMDAPERVQNVQWGKTSMLFEMQWLQRLEC